ncbi:glycosyltransferase family 2 protein [Luteimonas dalianensis]|uniref:glycosyltransferase family 2 protein n=1 Tax=Luteimonas dalianensis TaxID=1148196 RepID=UPI003BF1E421
MTAAMFDRPRSHPLQAPGATLPPDPLVSVVMTAFNSERWLEAAVASVLRQEGWKHLELVVVDDGSSDGSKPILDRLAAMDHRVRPFHLRRNIGTYRARNVGMSISRGHLITFMDSDDTASRDRIAQQAALLLQRDLVATTCNYVRRTASGRIVPMGGLEERQALVSLMFKRPVLADIGWFDSVRTSADDEFFERLRHVYGRHAHANVPRPLYQALHREQSLSTDPAAPVLLSATDGQDPLSGPRRAYKSAYQSWYERLRANGRRPYIPYNIVSPRPFPVPSELAVEPEHRACR